MDTIVVKIKKNNRPGYWYKYMIDCHFEVLTTLDDDKSYCCIRCLDVNKATAIPGYNHTDSTIIEKIQKNDFTGCYIDIDDVYTNKELRKQKINRLYDRQD